MARAPFPYALRVHAAEHKGNDVIYGGSGKDFIHGGDDYDYLHAQDGAVDGEVSCGTGGGKLADADSNDPGGGCD